MGDPNGVGPEVIVKILSQEWVYELCRPLVIGHDEVIRRNLPLARTGSSNDCDDRDTGTCLEIHRVDRPGNGPVPPWHGGRHERLGGGNRQTDSRPSTVRSRRLAVESVKAAARMALEGEIGAVVTAPMNKEAMGLAGYAFAGHTELLAEATGSARFRLSLAFDGILVSHATTHVSLRDAIDRLSEEEILITVELVGNALVGMGMAAPRIAVCGLNPTRERRRSLRRRGNTDHRTCPGKGTRERRHPWLAHCRPTAAGYRVHAGSERRFRWDHRHVPRSGPHSGQGPSPSTARST